MRSSSPASHSKAKQTDGEGILTRDKSEIPCRFKFCKKKPICGFWHPPACLNYKSEKGCVHGDKCHFRHVEANKKSKKGGAKGSVATLKESMQVGCVSQDSYLRKSTLREPGMLGSNRPSKFSKGKSTWHQIAIRERKGPSRGIIQKCAPHERSPCAPKFGERSHEETLHQERCARKAVWDLAKIFTSSRIRIKLRFIFLVKQK